MQEPTVGREDHLPLQLRAHEMQQVFVGRHAAAVLALAEVPPVRRHRSVSGSFQGVVVRFRWCLVCSSLLSSEEDTFGRAEETSEHSFGLQRNAQALFDTILSV